MKLTNIELKYLNKTFGFLKIIKILELSPNNKRRYCEAECSCGNVVTRRIDKIVEGKSSCGCVTFYKNKDLIFTVEYRAWQEMKKRCYNKNRCNYHNYGKRGITVCDRWMNNFENFLEDMGNKPNKEYSLERINNDLGYYKENCKWATVIEQANNKRSNVLLTKDDITHTIAQWCVILGLNQSAVEERVKRGWSHEDCLKPIKVKKYIRGNTPISLL